MNRYGCAMVPTSQLSFEQRLDMVLKILCGKKLYFQGLFEEIDHAPQWDFAMEKWIKKKETK